MSRLLAAADDSPQEEPPATPLPTRLPRDCVLPSVLAPEAIPESLKHIDDLRPPQPVQPASSPETLLSSLRPPPLLSLQRLLLDLGTEATAPANMSVLARILGQFGRPSEPAVASALLFLTTAIPSDSTAIDSHTLFQLLSMFCSDPEHALTERVLQQALTAGNPVSPEWRPNVLVQAVTAVASQFNSPLDWKLVIRSLDVDGLESQLTHPAFIEIANAYITGTNGSRLPADCILEGWQHTPAQLCMITYALKSPKFINWDVLDAFGGASAEDRESPYSRVALVEKLVELDARDLLQAAVKESTEILVLSLSSTKPRSNVLLHHKLSLTLLGPIIALFPSSENRLRQVWSLSASLVNTALVSMWKEEPSILHKALEIGIQMTILQDLLSSGTSIEFSLELAMLAYQEDVLNFESWLTELLRARGIQSISALTIHMAQKVRRSEPISTGHLSVDALRIVFRGLITALRVITGPQAQELMDAVQNVYDMYCKHDIRMTDLSPSADLGNSKILLGSEVVPATQSTRVTQPTVIGSAQGGNSSENSEAASTAAAILLPGPATNDGGPSSFPSTVEKEADVFFGRLYEGEMPPDTAVDILRRLKASNSDHDRQVFNCALHTLFDEYRFFRKYPDRQLKITGVLFGSVVQYSLLSGTLLGLAAKCVLDALRTIDSTASPVGRLVKFGLVALERFKSRLHEWPQYCSHVLELQRLKELAPELIGEVQKALDMNGAVIPSAAEKKIGLSPFDANARSEPLLTSSGGPPLTSPMREMSPNAATRRMVSSPAMSSTNTPIKGRSISSTSLRTSPQMGVDGSLGMSPLDLQSLLGMSVEEANQVIAPDEATQDKMKFIFNNLSRDTMKDKVQEMLSILAPEYYHFLAVYIVVKRASMEANFHHLYLGMLDKMELQMPSLFPLVFHMTYRRVRVLLAGDKSTASTDRSILKSLGSWIGALTLQRNKPILRRDLDLKEALMDAYSNGRLTTVIPFVVKVLEHCRESMIFKVTNPWVRGVLSLMKEIYGVEDLKLNMKFELQILSKHLGIDVESIDPSDLLRNRPAPDKTHNPDFATKKSLISSPPRTSPSPTASPSPELRRPFVPRPTVPRPGAPLFSLAETRTGQPTLQGPLPAGPPTTGRMDIPSSLGQPSLSGTRGDPVGDLTSILASTAISPNPVTTSAQGQRGAIHASMGIGAVHGAGASHRQTNNMGSTENLIPNLAQYITVSPTLGLFQTSPNLKRMIPVAIDRAIREIIQPVVERSCAIAFLTTKELTLKDFSLEPDMGKIRRAALQMVQQLAGSLALVTSKEPLRVSMGNQMRTVLTQSAVGDQNLIEQTAQIVCASNLEIGCAIIEKHAKEKAARDLNEKIGPTFAARRSQQTAYNFGLPPGPEVFRVYDEFARITRSGLSLGYSQGGTGPGSTSQPLQASAATSQPASVPTNSVTSSSSTRNVQPVSDLRANGNHAEGKPDIRTPLPRNPTRPGGLTQGRPDAMNQIVGSRRAEQIQSTGDASQSTAAYGTLLPSMAAPTSVATIMLAIAGSSGSNGGSISHGVIGTGNPGSSSGEEAPSTQQVLERFNIIYPRIVSLITEIVSSASRDTTLADVPSDHEIHSLWVQIPAAVKRSVTADEAGMAVAQKVFKRLYEGDSGLYRETHVLLLEGLRESCRRLSKELSSWLAFSEERKKLHLECIVALMRPGALLNKTGYDEIVAKAIDNGRNLSALEFACSLIKRVVIDEPLATAAEMFLTLEAMAKVGRRANQPLLSSAPDGLISLVEAARSVMHKPMSTNNSAGGNSDPHHAGPNRPAREGEHTDPVGVKEYVGNVLLEWHRILANDTPDRRVPEHIIASFLSQLRGNVLTSDESKERFFRIAIDLVTAVTSTALRVKSNGHGVADDLAQFPYTSVEALVRMTGALSRREAANPSDGSGKGIGTISLFLTALAKDILKSGTGPDMRAHFRLFSGLIGELALGSTFKDQTTGELPTREPDAASTACAERLDQLSSRTESFGFLEDKLNGFSSCVRNAGMSGRAERSISLDNHQVLTAIVCGLSACSPAAVPSFAFSWLQLISNKELLPSLLSLANVNGWPLFRHLLVSMLEFLSSFLRDAEQPLTGAVKVLYSGMLRVLLVLLHDFPEFLCAYHTSFCDAIPSNCVQLRNLVLASFPRDMRLPDPFLPELNVDELPDMLRAPAILTNFTAPLEASGLRTVVDSYLQSASSLRGPRPPLEMEKNLTETGNRMSVKRYNIQAMSALVLYLGQIAVSRLQNGDSLVMNCPATDVFRSLTKELGPEGQNHLFNAIVNQLRYPNNNTMYYSNLLLLLFKEAGQDAVKEHITRVLVERIIANRPHPWGLLTTFVRLITNVEYNFWSHGFVRCAPEIEQLFENVAKFCVGPVMHSKQQSAVAAT